MNNNLNIFLNQKIDLPCGIAFYHTFLMRISYYNLHNLFSPTLYLINISSIRMYSTFLHNSMSLIVIINYFNISKFPTTIQSLCF